MPELNDHELLAGFARDESGAAFAALVARHVNLVYSTALRFTSNPHASLAQDITQAVFIILARKAGSLSPRTILSGWLYQTARLTAANFMKGEIRRQKREQEAYMQSTSNERDTETWKQIAPMLDEAMGRLGEADRNAIVLRFIENKTDREAGAALKITEATARKRVNRALEKLRRIFTKRGVALPATVIASAVTAHSVQAAPAALAATVAATAAKGISIPAAITTLVKGTMKTMTWLKLKFAAGVCLAALITGGAATVAISATGVGGNGTPGPAATPAQAAASGSTAALAADISKSLNDLERAYQASGFLKEHEGAKLTKGGDSLTVSWHTREWLVYRSGMDGKWTKEPGKETGPDSDGIVITIWVSGLQHPEEQWAGRYPELSLKNMAADQTANSDSMLREPYWRTYGCGAAVPGRRVYVSVNIEMNNRTDRKLIESAFAPVLAVFGRPPEKIPAETRTIPRRPGIQPRPSRKLLRRETWMRQRKWPLARMQIGTGLRRSANVLWL